jgi:hypothetical protein
MFSRKPWVVVGDKSQRVVAISPRKRSGVQDDLVVFGSVDSIRGVTNTSRTAKLDLNSAEASVFPHIELGKADGTPRGGPA